MTLATLQAQHPDWCFTCGQHRKGSSCLYGLCSASPVIAALKEELEKAEAWIDKLELEVELGEIALDDLEAERDTANGALLVMREQLTSIRRNIFYAVCRLDDLSSYAPPIARMGKEALGAARKVIDEALTNIASAAEAAERWIRENERDKLASESVSLLRGVLKTLAENPLPVPVATWQRHQWELEQLAAILNRADGKEAGE